MPQYKVTGVLGSVVGVHDSIDDVISTIAKQFPLTDKKVRSLSVKLSKASPGATVAVEYGGSGCDVYVLADADNKE